ncbi:hypothetical protein A2160_05720 [Candidatus Beckwithbacteria bacterium RBG_13_42_9]|uniref:Nucleoside 2-deoxyribosyltransferase n=1 Tax=Candidatus Beckwithbacteria bacterium RBG_13_42_9 TaxID=1797457 RepID=A0A1F5E654_9BACT|nr:MAG: hypothetical protein A2160_05720 [Candidatus Beckwithbacteria bacterium RBG_13_42_9]
MKVYFTASLTGKKLFGENYQKITSSLRRQGHQVFDEHIVNSTKEKIMNESPGQRLAYIKLLNKNLRWCDVVLAEVSYPSTSVGFEICLAMSRQKPVLAMHDERGDFPSLLEGFKEEVASIIAYKLDEVDKVLEGALEFIKDRVLTKRFTILFSPRIVRFLDTIAQTGTISRSEYIRDLILQDLRKRAK